MKESVSYPALDNNLLALKTLFNQTVMNEKMTIQQAIRDLALEYSTRLLLAIDNRTEEMLADDVSHYLIYKVLGISQSEGQQIDLYQNKGRFLYKYAGSFLVRFYLLRPAVYYWQAC